MTPKAGKIQLYILEDYDLAKHSSPIELLVTMLLFAQRIVQYSSVVHLFVEALLEG